MAADRERAYFGNVRPLPSGRFQARWKVGGRMHFAKTDEGRPRTFATERQARTWLNSHADSIKDGSWPPPPPPAAAIDLAAYAADWITTRRLAERSRDHYRQLMKAHIGPTFGTLPVDAITPVRVRQWLAGLDTGPTAKAHAYSLLKAIMATAVADDLIAANPCRERGAGAAPTVKRMKIAELDELAALTAAMPSRYRMMVQLAVWCSLRFGELAALRRCDVDTAKAILHVEQAVSRTSGGTIVKGPKSEAGRRTVTIPSHILAGLDDHMAEHTAPGAKSLLFPGTGGGFMAPSSLYKVFYPARDAAGRPDLRFHDLRHTGQTYAARNGANLPELMARAGQSTSGAALRYLHDSREQQKTLADNLAAFAAGPVKTSAAE